VTSVGRTYSKTILNVWVKNRARKISLYVQDVMLRVVHVLVKKWRDESAKVLMSFLMPVGMPFRL